MSKARPGAWEEKERFFTPGSFQFHKRLDSPQFSSLPISSSHIILSSNKL